MEPTETNMQQPVQQNGFPMGLVAIAIVAALGIGIFMYSRGSTNTTSAKTETAMVEEKGASDSGASAQVNTDNAVTDVYKNGAYDAVGSYMSPAGAEEIKVHVELKEGVISDAVVEPQATRPKSVEFQKMFRDNFKPMVVGKKIAEVKLDKVSGSSLTPKGFNDAIEKIKAEAKG